MSKYNIDKILKESQKRVADIERNYGSFNGSGPLTSNTLGLVCYEQVEKKNKDRGSQYIQAQAMMLEIEIKRKFGM